MKHYTTRFLKSLALFLMSYPISYILVAALLFDIPLEHCVGILLEPFYYFVSIAAVIAGYGIWEMRRWSWYLFIISQVFIGYENAVVVHGFAESHHKMMVFILSILFQIGLIIRIAKEIRVPYFFPKIRWWESNPRYRFSTPVKVIRKSNEFIEGEILDLSLAGCFIKVRQDLLQDEEIHLEFSPYGYPIKCDGKVVWCAQSAVTHPKGIGVKFSILPRSQRRTLRYVVRILKKITILYRRFRYLSSEEEFLKQLEALEKSKPQKKLKLMSGSESS